jgi:hypothetical protein
MKTKIDVDGFLKWLDGQTTEPVLGADRVIVTLDSEVATLQLDERRQVGLDAQATMGELTKYVSLSGADVCAISFTVSNTEPVMIHYSVLG